MNKGFSKMKKALLAACVLLLLGGVTVSAFAAGGKHHGDIGKGQVIQHQIRNVP
jgi:hypothetical protein